MALNCGIVGLPNVGKSTIFSALTAAPAEAANYPFCTIDPNVGVVEVPDDRLAKIAEKIVSKKIIPAIVEFVDIAGLVRGASRGEGLGNKFLSHIREVGMIVHVVRCFENPDIVHVENRIDPAGDIETINIELALADLETVDKRIARLEKDSRTNKDAQKLAATAVPVLKELRELLQDGRPARALQVDEDLEAEVLRDLHLITRKRILYVCNVDEAGLKTQNEHVAAVRRIAEAEGTGCVVLCGQIEKEITALDSPEDRAIFLEDLGLEESGLSSLIREAYKLLGLRTYFTAGPQEIHAWTFKQGDKAPVAAGIIHSDFEKGFIRAETYAFDDLITFGTEAKVREAGKLRQEGKEYAVRDGDIMHFKFN